MASTSNRSRQTATNLIAFETGYGATYNPSKQAEVTATIA